MSGIFRISDVTKWKAEKLFPKVLELERVIWIQRMGAKNQPNKQHNKWPDAGRDQRWKKCTGRRSYPQVSTVAKFRERDPGSPEASVLATICCKITAAPVSEMKSWKKQAHFSDLIPFWTGKKGFSELGAAGGGSDSRKAAVAFEVNHPIIITQNESNQRAYYQTLPERRSAPPGP